MPAAPVAEPIPTLPQDPTSPVGMPERDQEGPLAHAAIRKSIDGTWFWTGAPGEMVAERERYFVNIGNDGVELQADCNRGRASIERDNDSVRFGAPGLSKMGCPAGSSDQRFLGSLSGTHTMIANDAWALASNDKGSVVGIYSRKPEATLKTYTCTEGSFQVGLAESEIALFLRGQLYTLIKLPDNVEERWGDGIFEFRGKEGAITLAGRGPTLKGCRSTP